MNDTLLPGIEQRGISNFIIIFFAEFCINKGSSSSNRGNSRYWRLQGCSILNTPPSFHDHTMLYYYYVSALTKS